MWLCFQQNRKWSIPVMQLHSSNHTISDQNWFKEKVKSKVNFIFNNYVIVYYCVLQKFLVLAILVAAVSADVRDILNKNDAPYNYQQPQQSLAKPQAQQQQQQPQPQQEQNNVDAEFNSLPDQKYSQPQAPATATGAQLNFQAGSTSLPSFAQGASFAQSAQNTLPAFSAQAPSASSAQFNSQAGPASLPSFAAQTTSAQGSLQSQAALVSWKQSELFIFQIIYHFPIYI